jgi:hypothetical protein
MHCPQESEHGDAATQGHDVQAQPYGVVTRVTPTLGEVLVTVSDQANSPPRAGAYSMLYKHTITCG